MYRTKTNLFYQRLAYLTSKPISNKRVPLERSLRGTTFSIIIFTILEGPAVCIAADVSKSNNHKYADNHPNDGEH